MSISSGGVPSTGLPVAASSSLSSLVLMKTFLSLALNSSRASCSASISGAASGLPLVDHRVDGIDGVAEIVGGEARQRVFVGTGMREACAGDEQTEDEYERHDAIVKGTHCNRSRRQVWRIGGGGLPAASALSSDGRQTQEPDRRTSW